jgi:hypothetical protein
MKKLFIAVLVVGGATQWWMRQPAAVAVASAPPEVRIAAPASERDAPLQREVSGGNAFEINGHEARPLAEYAVTARVLSVERYHADRGAQLSPVDLALGWGNMSRRSVLDRLSISQGGRWYHYRYSGEPPIPQREIERSSANVHVIPATPEVARVLADASKDTVVSLRGYLIEARGTDGWTWRSSLTRDDTGNGSCEVMFVQSVEVYR